MDKQECKRYLQKVVKKYYHNFREKISYKFTLEEIELDILKEYVNNHKEIFSIAEGNTGESIENKTIFESLKQKYEINEEEFCSHIRKLYFYEYLDFSKIISSKFSKESDEKKVDDAINFFCNDLLPDERKSIYEEIVFNVFKDYSLEESGINIDNKGYTSLEIQESSGLRIDYSDIESIKSEFEKYKHEGREADKYTRMEGRLYLTMRGYQKVISDMTSEMIMLNKKILSISEKSEELNGTVESLSDEVKSVNSKTKNSIDNFYKNIITIISILIAAIAIVNTNINTLPKISNDSVFINLMSIITINMSIVFVILSLFWILGYFILDYDKNKLLNMRNFAKKLLITIVIFFIVLFIIA